MKIFYTDHYVLPLPEGHRFPMAKYRMLRERVAAAALGGFNVGVELGQLAIVGAFLPIAWLLRHTRFYRWVIVTGGSAAIVVLGLFWTLDRIGWLG